MLDKRDCIESVFDNHSSSLPGRRIAHVSREHVTDAILAQLRKCPGALLVYGCIGVGKSSAVEYASGEVQRLYAGKVGYRRIRRLMHSDLLGGFSCAVANSVRDLVTNPQVLPNQGDERPAFEIAQWLDNARLLLIFENAQALSNETITKISGLAKYLAEEAHAYHRSKIVVVASGPATLISRGVPGAIRPAVDFVPVPPWPDSDLERIMIDGTSKCELQPLPAVVAAIATFSCGIPAATHLMAREVCLKAVLEKSPAVTRTHFEQILGNPARLEDLSQRLIPDIDYIYHWKKEMVLVPAVVALAGRLRRAFSVGNALDVFDGMATYQEVMGALDKAIEVPLALEKQDNTYKPLELVACITAMLELQVRARRSNTEGVLAGHLLDKLMKVPQSIDFHTEAEEYERGYMMTLDNPQTWMPIIVEATKFVFNEVGKWIDSLRKETQEKETVSAPNSRDGVALPIGRDEFDSLQNDLPSLSRRVNTSIAQAEYYIIEQTMSRVKTHLEVLADLKQALAREVDQNTKKAIEFRRDVRERNELLVESADELLDQLRRVYRA